MLAFYLMNTALSAEPQDWDALDAARIGERPAPAPELQLQMMEEALRLAQEGDHPRALAQVQEARCRADPACREQAEQVVGLALEEALRSLPADPAQSLGLRSVWLQWPLSAQSQQALLDHYTALGEQLEPGVEVQLLDSLARELPPEHPLSQALIEHLDPSPWSAHPGAEALLEAAQARYLDQEHTLEPLYPQTLGLSLSADACEDLLSTSREGDLVAEVQLEVLRCETRTETWEESEDYTWMETEVYEAWEDVVVGYDEECTERLYYDDNNIQKEGWTETVCEDVPITESQKVQRTRQVERSGRRLVQHRRYLFEYEAQATASLETELERLQVAELVQASSELLDFAYDAEGGSRSWDSSLNEEAARLAADSQVTAAALSLGGPMEQAYAEQLLAAAMDERGPAADELLVQLWWWDRTIQPSSGPLHTAMSVVEQPPELELAHYALPPLGEAPLIIDGYGQLHDTRDGSGWQVRSPGLLRPTNSGLSVGLDLRQSYLGPGWAQSVKLALRGGGGVDYASSSTFTSTFYGGVSTELDEVPDSAGAMTPLGWFAGFSTGGGWGNPETRSGGVLAFHLAYAIQRGHDGEQGYRALSMVFPDLTLCLPGTRWMLGANVQVAWNWLGLQDPKKRQAGEDIPYHHFTPISLGPAIGLGPVQLKAHATYLAFRAEPLRFGTTLDLAF